MNVTNQSPTCPVCGNATSPRFSVPCDWRKPDIPKEYKIDWCIGCDYGQVWERPSAGEVSSFYQLDDYYTHNSNDIYSKDENMKFLDRLRVHLAWRIDKGTDLTPHDAMSLLRERELSVCEIGCGNGSNLSNFRKNGFSVVGVEPDSTARKIADEALGNIYEGTAESLPVGITKKKYDVVLMSHVLEHCLDINIAVSNVRTILKDGGVFIVETPNCKSLGFTKYRGEWPWADIPRHLNFFTPDSLLAIVSKHGFHVVDTKYRGFCRQFSTSWLQNERNIWQAFSAYQPNQSTLPNFKIRAWLLLIKSLLATKARKYDSVRLIAVNSGT